MDACPLQPQVQRVEEATEGCRAVPSVVLTGHGRLQRIKVMDTPLSRSLKNDHVEVQVFYCGLNFTDNYLRLGIIRSGAFPIIMGSECCGIVRRVGDAVDDLEAGQRVVCLRMHGGLFRQLVHVPRSHCFAVPSYVTLTAAAALALDFLVAYVSLLELGQLRVAGVAFMQSLAGGVGTVLAQLCHGIPLMTVLGTASEDKHDRLRQLGVSQVYRHEEDFAERVLALYPQGADIVIVRGGGADTDKCLRLLKPCGRLVVIGSDNTATYPRTITMALRRPTWDTRYISSAELINKNVVVAGLNIADFIETYPADVQAIMEKLFALNWYGNIKPQVHAIVPFEKMADGLEMLCRRENFGKVLLQVQDEADPTVRPSPEEPLESATPPEEPLESATPPEEPLESATPPEERRRRAEMVMCRRRIKLWLREAEAAQNRLDEEEAEAAQSRRDEEEAEAAQSRRDEEAPGAADLDDSMFTEVEASMAAEMVKAISESEGEANASGNL